MKVAIYGLLFGECVMNSYFAHGKYVLNFGLVMAITTMALRYHALGNYVGAVTITVTRNKVAQDIFKINLPDFVFFDAGDLVKFEHKKKERAQHLIEQLCGIRQKNIHRDKLRGQAALRVVRMRSHTYERYGRQSFGVPYAIYDHTIYKNALTKQIALQQASKNSISPEKLRVIAALEKLLE